MGIMTRMLQLCKADAHGVMDQLEDKDLLLRQHLREMASSLDASQQQLDDFVRREEHLIRQIARHKKEMGKLETDLTLALEKEKDDIARLLIRRRKVREAACARLAEQMETIVVDKAQMADRQDHRRRRYEELKIRAAVYQNRRHASPSGMETVPPGDDWTNDEPTDEEIELELLQRKEALHEEVKS